MTGTSTLVLVAVAGCSHKKGVSAQEVGKLLNYVGGRWGTGTSTLVLVAVAGCSHKKWVSAQEVGELL